MTDQEKPRHRNDIYRDLDKTPAEEIPAIPAATVVLLRDGAKDTEVLMLHRTSKVHFGGMWVFPGGRIDDEDYPDDGDLHVAARNAAARETLEETGITVSADNFVCFAHWTPAAATPRRYATWFFATPLDDDQAIKVDGFEIQNHEWIHPSEMLAKHTAGEVDLVPPTWVTLYHLSLYRPVAAILERFAAHPHRIYETKIATRSDDIRVAMWDGDAGYESGNADADGDRHRLIMAEDGFTFENTVVDY